MSTARILSLICGLALSISASAKSIADVQISELPDYTSGGEFLVTKPVLLTPTPHSDRLSVTLLSKSRFNPWGNNNDCFLSIPRASLQDANELTLNPGVVLSIGVPRLGQLSAYEIVIGQGVIFEVQAKSGDRVLNMDLACYREDFNPSDDRTGTLLKGMLNAGMEGTFKIRRDNVQFGQ